MTMAASRPTLEIKRLSLIRMTPEKNPEEQIELAYVISPVVAAFELNTFLVSYLTISISRCHSTYAKHILSLLLYIVRVAMRTTSREFPNIENPNNLEPSALVILLWTRFQAARAQTWNFDEVRWWAKKKRKTLQNRNSNASPPYRSLSWRTKKEMLRFHILEGFLQKILAKLQLYLFWGWVIITRYLTKMQECRSERHATFCTIE